MAVNAPAEYGPQVEIGCWYGNPTVSSVVLVACAFEDPGVTPVEVSVDGGAAQTITMVAVGTDNPDGGAPAQACWVGNITLSGLNGPLDRTPAVVSQGAKSTSLSLLTAPAAGQAHSVFVSTCISFNSGFRTLKASDSPWDPQTSGMFSYIREYGENATVSPMSALAIVDDVFYPDWTYVDDLNVGNGGLGVRNSDAAWNGVGSADGVAYDYCLAYMAYMGMLGDVTSDPGLAGEAGYTARMYRHSDYIYILHNFPFLPQYGDHNVSQDFGMNATSTAGGEPAWGGGTRVSQPTRWANAITDAYDHFLKPLQGPSIQSADTGANHWALTMGDLVMVAPDAMYNGTGDGTGGYQPVNTQMTTMVGDNQIDDCLSALNVSGKWKVLLSPFSMRWMGTALGGTDINGANWPLYNWQLSEYQRFFTLDNGSSICSNPTTRNSTMVINGDFHWLTVKEAAAPAYTGNVSENSLFWLEPGTINGSQNFNADNFTGGNTYQDVNLLYSADTWPYKDSGNANMGFGAVRLDVTAGKLEAHVLNGKASDDFQLGEFVVSLPKEIGMVQKTNEDISLEQQSIDHVLDGDELARSDYGPSGSMNSCAKTWKQIQKLFADLGFQLGIAPGNAVARTKVVSHQFGQAPGVILLPSSEIVYGISRYRITLRWSRTSAVSGDLRFALATGGGPAQDLAEKNYTATTLQRGAVEFILDAVSSTEAQSWVQGADFEAEPLAFNVNSAWNGSITDLRVKMSTTAGDTINSEMATLEYMDTAPAQTTLGVAQFPSLQQGFFASQIASPTDWPQSKEAGSALSFNPVGDFDSGFGFQDGLRISMYDQGTGSMSGAWDVPSDQVYLAVACGKIIDGSTSEVLTIGDTALNGLTFGNGNATVKNNDGSALFAPQVQGVDPTAIAHLIQPGVGFRRYICTDTLAIVSQDVNTTPATSLVPWTVDYEAGLNGDNGYAQLLFFSFSDGVPSDIETAIQWMADNPTLGPYPGWHALT